MIEVINTDIEGLLIIKPSLFHDSRGSFAEVFSQREFDEKVGRTEFVQDNESRSGRGVLRGFHYQLPPAAQAKLVRVSEGRVLDVALDMRKGSPTLGRYCAVELSSENGLQLFIPRGFAHAFLVLSVEAVVDYKCDNYYSPEQARGVAFDDPAVGVDWGMSPGELILSEKDRVNPAFADAALFDLKPGSYQ